MIDAVHFAKVAYQFHCVHKQVGH